MRALLNLIALCFLTTAFAADWPCWRGIDGHAVSPEKNLPVEWSKEKNIKWKTAIPGKGASSPIIFGERVYITSQTEETGLHVLALESASGKILWDRQIGEGKLPANGIHNMAS